MARMDREKRARPPRAVISEHDGWSLAQLLDYGLETAHFDRVAQSKGPNANAVILLDFGAFALPDPTVPHRLLIERLIDRCASLGWRNIALASTADGSSLWADNRSVAALADLLGYCYETANGNAYEILDLSDELIAADFEDSSPLRGGQLARPWLEADLRIVVGKLRTDQCETFAFSASTLLCALPLVDKDYYYRLHMELGSALASLLRRTPVSFSIIDACDPAHGSGGRQAPMRANTHAIICGRDLLAVDCAAAGKIDVDYAQSPLLKRMIEVCGLPNLADIRGPRRRFVDFKVPSPQLVASSQARDRSPFFARLLAPWLQQIDTDLFPLKHPLDAKIHPHVATRFAHLDADPVALGSLIALNNLCAGLASAVTGWRTVTDKDKLTQRSAPISPETLLCEDVDYRRMEQELDQLNSWLLGEFDATDALCWRFLNRAVVFSISHEYPIRLSDFVSKIDIARTIQFMNDYIGGTLIPVARDAKGRPVRQVERNLYLAQPNYLAFAGGKEIDVSKIESVHYGGARQRMYWKTVKSENGSAVFDDGIVTFQGKGAFTRVTIFGRQLFVLPPFWEQLNLDLYPELKSRLVTHAYQTFFARTFSNFEAMLEDREIRIGRALCNPKHPADSPERPIDLIADLGRDWLDRAAPLLEKWAARGVDRSSSPAGLRDSNDFLHFRPTGGAPERKADTSEQLAESITRFYTGWWEAVARDSDSIAHTEGSNRLVRD
jgi:uncharacterized protein (DUF362 family)